MREVFAKSVHDERVSVSEGTFDTTGVENGWADLVVIAQVPQLSLLLGSEFAHAFRMLQAFHWCPDYDKASAEFARILKPDGIVAFIWNLEDR